MWPIIPVGGLIQQHCPPSRNDAVGLWFQPDGAAYWSGVANASDNSESWVVNCNFGSSSPRKWVSPSHVRLVIGIPEKPPTNKRYTDNLDGTITDNLTKLIWDKCALGLFGDMCNVGSASDFSRDVALYNIYSAIAMANNSTYKGYSDWRLPNRNELSSLVELSSHHQAINPVALPNTPSAWFRTSTITVWIYDFYMYHQYEESDLKYILRFVDFAEGGESNLKRYDFNIEYWRKDYIRLVRGGSDFDTYGSRDKWTQPPFHIVIKKPRHGLVVSSPEKIRCGGTSTEYIGDLAYFKLTAHPNPGYSFGGWVGCPDMTYDDSDNVICILNADNRDSWHQKRGLPLKNRYRGFVKALFVKSRKHMH